MVVTVVHCLGDGQTKAYLKDTGMTGLAFSWAMAYLKGMGMTGLASVWPDGVLSEGYEHGVCLGVGQTEDEGVPSQGGRGDVLLRRMPP